MRANVAPDGIITLSFVFAEFEVGDEDKVLLGFPTRLELPAAESDGVAELPEFTANGVIRSEETACFVKLTSAWS